jgi:DNA-binding MarR family transcriptional regulator
MSVEAGLGGQVRSTVGLLYRRFRSERAEGSLGDAALDVLIRLYKTGPQTLTELSEHDHGAPASMSQSVNRLTSAGYAIRTPDPNDRRKVLFSTTPEGAELAAATRHPPTTPCLAGRPPERPQPRGSGHHRPRVCAAAQHGPGVEGVDAQAQEERHLDRKTA